MITIFPEDAIDNFIAPRVMGVAGVSDNRKKFGYLAYIELKRRGYTLYPLNRSGKTIDGDICLSNVLELPPEVKNLLIILPPVLTEKLVKEIDPSAIKMVWMQNGAESEKAIRMCRGKRIDVIYKHCILMHARPVRSYHLLHRWWWLASMQNMNKESGFSMFL
ncbi:MAG TPA: CoA-binding protein [Smithella sp.]|nr:CoA-binding protein [Smithella sp.]